MDKKNNSIIFSKVIVHQWNDWLGISEYKDKDKDKEINNKNFYKNINNKYLKKIKKLTKA